MKHAPSTVIASEAKQSRVARVALDCFASLAMTAVFGAQTEPTSGFIDHSNRIRTHLSAPATPSCPG
ncbi:hypothetical protein BRAO375_3740006 [Bradyrhizobium sp. ORS 375]|nr:hypothetical protein BRAO375_3740006 [Bradyrhizobium sp. ORS 375]